MAKIQNIKDTLDKALAVWKKEGLDPLESGNFFQNIDKDPVVRLLLGAVNYQTDIIADDIQNFKNDLLDSIVDLCSPEYLLQAHPAVAMLQTGKMHKPGLINKEPTRVDGEVSFSVSPSGSSSSIKYLFMPLLETTVFDASVRSIHSLENGRWSLEIEEKEPISSLGGLALYMPNLPDCSRITIYSNNTPLNVSCISDFDSLPFVRPFLSGMRFSKNAMQCATLQSIHDSLCRYVNNYCIIESASNHEFVRRDGCIVLELGLDGLSADYPLNPDDILLNCVPVAEIESHATTLSLQHPLQRLDLRGSQFLSLSYLDSDGSGFPSVVLRTTATERMSPSMWLQQMNRLIDYYNAEYLILNQVVDAKLEGLMQQFMAAIKDSMSKRSFENDNLYLVLNDKSIPSLSAVWFSTHGASANGLDEHSIVDASSIEFDARATRFVSVSLGGQDRVDDRQKRLSLTQYWLSTRDRVVSKSDIISLCRFSLMDWYGLKSEEIKKISFSSVVQNSREGFFERILVLNVFVAPGCLNDINSSQRALDRIIASRNASTSTVRVKIEESL